MTVAGADVLSRLETWRPDWRSIVACFSSWQPSTSRERCCVAGTRRPLCRWGRTIRAGTPYVDVTLGRVWQDARPCARRLHATTYKMLTPSTSGLQSYCTSSPAMKSSVFIVLVVVLVASTYAGYVGPYRHYYVPGFQHTYVPVVTWNIRHLKALKQSELIHIWQTVT